MTCPSCGYCSSCGQRRARINPWTTAPVYPYWSITATGTQYQSDWNTQMAKSNTQFRNAALKWSQEQTAGSTECTPGS